METLENPARRRAFVSLKPFKGKVADLIERFRERFGTHEGMELFHNENLLADEILDTPLILETITPFDLELRTRIMAPNFFQMASSQFNLKKCHASVPLRLALEIDSLRSSPPRKMELHPILVMAKGLDIGIQITLPHPGDAKTLKIKVLKSGYYPIEVHEPCLFQVN